MAHSDEQRPARVQNSQESIVRTWDAETNSFSGSSGRQSLKRRVEQLLDLLQRRKWLILFFCLAVVVGTALYTYAQSPLYRASSLVLVEKNDKVSQQATQFGAANQRRRLLSSSASLESELIYLQNARPLRVRVAKRLIQEGKADQLLNSGSTSALHDVGVRVWRAVRESMDLQTASGAGTSPRGNGGSDGQVLSPDSVAAVLAGHMKFERTKKSANIIRVVAQEDEPKMASYLANLFAQEYVEQTKESSRAQASASRAFLEQRAQELNQRLRSVEQKVQEYKRRENALSLDQRQKSLTDRIAQANSNLEQARIDLRMERSSLESLRKELKSVRPEQISKRVESTIDEEVQSLQAKVSKLELAKQELLLQSETPGRSDSAQVAQIDRRIHRLRSRIAELSDRYVTELMDGGLSAEESARRVDELKRRIAEKEIKINGLESRIQVLTERLGQYEREMGTIPEKSMELAQLMRSKRYTEQMYEFVTKRLQEARVKENSQIGYATSVAEASVPGVPVQPRPFRNLLFSLVFGLIGGLGVALTRDLLDNRVYKPEQIRALGYRDIGMIPNLTPLINNQLGGQPTVEKNGRQLESTLVGAIQPNSAAAEAYRKLRTNVWYNGRDEEVSTVVVTSPGSKDGKSVTSANLAVVTARAGHSTLLIDADLRRPRLHEVFDASQAPGLAEALQDDLREHVMEKASVENLCVLPAGGRLENPSKTLGSQEFGKFLSRAQQHFDYVILDSPPVLATADSAILAAQCDETLCVVRAGRTTESELQDAMEMLDGVKANIAGIVFNGFDLSMAYGYKYRYRNYTEYGPYDQYQALPEKAGDQ